MDTAINDTGPRCDGRHHTLHRNDGITASARALARNFLVAQGKGDLVDAGEICISELVGNSVRHTASPAIIIQMWPNDGSPLFEVWDDSREIPEFPQTVSFDDLEAESGRGLSLVKQLSLDCGTVSSESPKGGKIVWFRL